MKKTSLPYFQEIASRHGKMNRYFRKGGKRIPLPNSVPMDSKEFLEAYSAAKEICMQAPKTNPTKSYVSGSFGALCAEYLNSAVFGRLKLSTQTESKREIVKLQEKYAELPTSRLDAKFIRRKMDEVGRTKPAAANNMLAAFKKLLNFAIQRDYCKSNVALGIQKLKCGEYRAWTQDELVAFEKRWPIGTRQRLCFALALYTGQRKSDLLALTMANFKDGHIQLTQQKTNSPLSIPIHNELKIVLDQRPKKGLALIAQRNGRPLKSRHLGTLMQKAIKSAGLSEECVLHGLRKTAAKTLAEVGCTAHEIMSITGHRDLKMVEHYTKAAGQKGLAQSAMDKWTKKVP